MAAGRRNDRKEGTSAQPEKVVRICTIDRNCLQDLQWWSKEDPKVCEKALSLMEHVLREPFTGLGKPEPLKHLGAGTWSRRLTGEHRLVYVVFSDKVTFVQARFHY